MNRHTENKQYECAVCGEKFYRRYIMTNHVAQKHKAKTDVDCSNPHKVENKLSVLKDQLDSDEFSEPQPKPLVPALCISKLLVNRIIQKSLKEPEGHSNHARLMPGFDTSLRRLLGDRLEQFTRLISNC